MKNRPLKSIFFSFLAMVIIWMGWMGLKVNPCQTYLSYVQPILNLI